MNPLKQFDDFLKEGVVRRQSPDKEKAKFLIEEAENSYLSLLDMLKKVSINNQNANTNTLRQKLTEHKQAIRTTKIDDYF